MKNHIIISKGLSLYIWLSFSLNVLLLRKKNETLAVCKNMVALGDKAELGRFSFRVQ